MNSGRSRRDFDTPQSVESLSIHTDKTFAPVMPRTAFSASPNDGHHYLPASSRNSCSPAGLPFTGQTPLRTSHEYFAQASSGKLQIAHPYARLFAKKDDAKRRRIWNHALEKSIFTPYELSTVRAPHRRRIYLASLEDHINSLHAQLLDIDCCPVSAAELEPFRGLNCKTAKSMVCILQHEVSLSRLKLLELERANAELECLLRTSENIPKLSKL